MNFSNKAKANLLASISSSATNIILELGKWALFPLPPFSACIEQYNAIGLVIAREVVMCTSITWDVLAVTRATEPIPNDDITSAQSQIARNFDLNNGVVQISNVITWDFVNTLENSIENAVHKTGNETVEWTKHFSNNDTYFGDITKSFADIGNLWTNDEVYIDARSNTNSTVSLKLRSKWAGQMELMTNNVPRVYIDGNGNVWVGTFNPTATLDVNGSVRLRTGAGIGKTLVCNDTDGNATWQSGLTAWKTSWDFTAWEDISGTLSAPKAVYLWGDGQVYNTASFFIGKFIWITTQTVLRGNTINVIMNGVADVSWFNTGSRYFVNTPAYTWATKASMPTARVLSAAAEYLGKIYVVWWRVGLTYLNSNQEYDTVTNTWATKANLPNARCWLSASTVAWKIYVYGWNTTSSTLTNIMEEYNPTTNTWLSKTAWLVSSTEHSEFVINDKIYIVGGGIATGPTNLLSEYTPATDTWAVKAPAPISRYGSCAESINWLGFVFWWANGVSNNDSLYEYNPTLNSWTLKASSWINSPNYPSSFVIGGRLYVCGGYASGVLSSVMYYDPNLNTWTNSWVMTTWVYISSSSYYNGKGYVFWGQSNWWTIATTQEYANALTWWALTSTATVGILAGQAVSPTKFLISNNIL